MLMHAKQFGSVQPATQADLCQNFLQVFNFLHIKGPYCFVIHLVVKTKRKMDKAKTCMPFRSNRLHGKDQCRARMRRYA